MNFKANTVKTTRSQKGSMLYMCMATFAMIVFIAGIAFGAYFLFYSQKTLETHNEDFVLRAAQELNRDDCAGKLNNLHARSRELVYTARQMNQMCEDDEDYAELAPLARQIMNQSRDGAMLVATERKKFAALSITNLRTLMKNEVPAESAQGVANVSASNRRIVDIQVGHLANMASNVEPNSSFEDVYEWDMSQGYIQKGIELNLYKSGVNLKLPGPDHDLDFELAALPAPVKGTLSPLRLTSGAAFKDTLALRKDGEDTIGTCAISPSAVRVRMAVNIKEKFLTDVQSDAQTINTACTNGAAPEPR